MSASRPGDAGADLRGGVLVVDKPPGPTSHDIVAVVRRRFRGAKVGHTGTLDPFATGVLPLVIGRATRLAQHLTGADKEYDAFIRLGRATDTHDATGTVVFEAPEGLPLPGIDVVAAVLDTYRGTWMQTPPIYSAKRAGGVRAYEQARRGKPVELAPVEVTVSELELLSLTGSLVRVRLVSSAGFYVRALAHDLGVKLGTGATLDGLRRLRSGPFGLAGAVTLDVLALSDPGARLLPLESLLPDWPAVGLTREGVEWVSHGREVGPAQCAEGCPSAVAGRQVRFLGPDGRLAAIGVVGPGGVLHPSVVLM
ncbi:MAG: tRNA pseudouridine(55) synthase TruB [Vicinamibacterales bacterium]